MSTPDVLSRVCACPAEVVARPAPAAGLGVVLAPLAADGTPDGTAVPHTTVAAAVLWANRHGIKGYRVLVLIPADGPADGAGPATV